MSTADFKNNQAADFKAELTVLYDVSDDNIALSFYAANGNPADAETLQRRRHLLANGDAGTTIVDAKISTFQAKAVPESTDWDQLESDFSMSILDEPYEATAGTEADSIWIILICVAASILVVVIGIVMYAQYKSQINQQQFEEENGHEELQRSVNSRADVCFTHETHYDAPNYYAPYYDPNLLYPYE